MRLILKLFLIFKVILTLNIVFINTALSGNYEPVFKLFEKCIAIKLPIGPILHDKCVELFEKNIKKSRGISLPDFNNKWSVSGKYSLIEKPNQYYNLTLSRNERNIIAKFREAMEPNLIGYRDTGLIKKELISSLKNNYYFKAKLVYSQLSFCFSRMEKNARFLRELISKNKYASSQNKIFSLRDLSHMYNLSFIYKSSEHYNKSCNKLNVILDDIKPRLIKILTNKLKNWSAEERACQSFLEFLENNTKYDESKYSKFCQKFYLMNLKRLLPIANNIFKNQKEMEKIEENKNKTSEEQLIK